MLGRGMNTPGTPRIYKTLCFLRRAAQHDTHTSCNDAQLGLTNVSSSIGVSIVVSSHVAAATSPACCAWPLSRWCRSCQTALVHVPAAGGRSDSAAAGKDMAAQVLHCGMGSSREGAVDMAKVRLPCMGSTRGDGWPWASQISRVLVPTFTLGAGGPTLFL